MTRYSIVLVGLLLALVGCKDGGSPTSNSPTPTPPAAATPPPAPAAPVLELTVTGTKACADPFCDTSNYTLTFTNAGNVALNIDFLQGLNASGTPIFDIGSDKFIRAFGTNNIAPGGKLDGVLNSQTAFGFRIQYTGANGVTKVLVFLA